MTKVFVAAWLGAMLGWLGMGAALTHASRLTMPDTAWEASQNG